MEEILVFFKEESLWRSIVFALLVFLLVSLIGKLFFKYIYSYVGKIFERTENELYVNIVNGFKKPFRLFTIILGLYLASLFIPFNQDLSAFVLKVFRSSIVILLAIGLFNISSTSSQLVEKIGEKFNIQIDKILIPFISKTMRIVIVAITISVVLQEFDYDVGGFVAGLGLGGLAFAFAAKDALADVIGGIVIITEKPFSIGDWIKTPSVEGTVEDITFRSTRIRRFDQALVTIPNSTLSKEAITNWSRMGKRRVTFNLEVRNNTPKDNLERAVRGIESMLVNHEDIHQDVIFVKFNGFNNGNLIIYLYFFSKTTIWKEWLEVKEDVHFKILDILEKENVQLAYPGQSLYVEQLPLNNISSNTNNVNKK